MTHAPIFARHAHTALSTGARAREGAGERGGEITRFMAACAAFRRRALRRRLLLAIGVCVANNLSGAQAVPRRANGPADLRPSS